jgi:hypothetical protein
MCVDCVRIAVTGRPDDVGDIDGIPGVVVEVKNHKTLTIPAWLNELEVEMSNARAVHGAVVAKRRGSTDVGSWYAIAPFADWVRLLLEAGWGAQPDGPLDAVMDDPVGTLDDILRRYTRQTEPPPDARHETPGADTHPTHSSRSNGHAAAQKSTHKQK